MIFREPPGILQEVGVAINLMISGCNSAKKFIFFKIKVATLSTKISVPLILTISGCFRMSQKETRGRF